MRAPQVRRRQKHSKVISIDSSLTPRTPLVWTSTVCMRLFCLLQYAFARLSPALRTLFHDVKLLRARLVIINAPLGRTSTLDTDVQAASTLNPASSKRFFIFLPQM